MQKRGKEEYEVEDKKKAGKDEEEVKKIRK